VSLQHQRLLAGIDALGGFVHVETGPLRGPWTGDKRSKPMPPNSSQHDLAPPKDPTPPKDDKEKQDAHHKHSLKKMGHEPDGDDAGDEPDEIEPEPEGGEAPSGGGGDAPGSKEKDEPEDDEEEPEEEPDDEEGDDEGDDDEEEEPKKGSKSEALAAIRSLSSILTA